MFDRASLVALPPKMRVADVEKMQHLLKPGTKILLVVFDYQQQDMQKSPFSVETTEIEGFMATGVSWHYCVPKTFLIGNPIS